MTNEISRNVEVDETALELETCTGTYTHSTSHPEQTRGQGYNRGSDPTGLTAFSARLEPYSADLFPPHFLEPSW
jgi:hypothetical protein